MFLFINSIAVSLFFLELSFGCNPAFYFSMGKSYKDISPPHVSVIAGNILITIIRFSHSHLLLASNSIFMIDFLNLGTNQISRNVNKHYYS